MNENDSTHAEAVMPLIFYPHSEDTQKGALSDRIEVLMEAAERYKAYVLDLSAQQAEQSVSEQETSKKMVPRELAVAFNWEEIARVLREVRESSEASKADKTKKSALLKKLAEVYEVLRGAKMPKLEAVRLALISEANHLNT